MQTRVIGTLGPASRSDAVLRGMVRAGISFARLNFSHGRPEEHEEMAARLRRIADEVGCAVDLIQDLQGPKIRTVNTPYTLLSPGGEIVLSGDGQGAGVLRISEPAALAGVAPGHRIYLDDGMIDLEVLERTEDGVRCRVVIGGTVEGNQGVVFPSSQIPLPPLTAKDIADARIGREIGVQWVALSFVQRALDLEALRPHLAPGARIIAKVETAGALHDLEAIIAAADAVMIARGDLGVSIPRARVPLVQKDIVLACRRRGTTCIVATEMLLSMVLHPHPTRAEVADVATAVLDGAHVLMLSEETAIGAYPIQAVTEMREIIATVEASSYYPWRAAVPNPEADKP
ncbi:MAG: pyruvate kinase [Chloroflexi bacterium]|nr:pyruvate kinase [Chloroflexota bacterium]